MKTTTHLIAAALLSLGFAACASTNPDLKEPTMDTPSSRLLTVPRSAGDGGKKDVTVLLDERHLKLATIALRDGTSLPPHRAPVPVTIHVLEGDGVIHAGGKPLAVTGGSLVSLAANEDHDVIPKAASDMLLLVHYLRGAQ